MSQIVLYSNASENEKLDKAITVIDTLTGSFRGEVNVVNPVIRIQPTASATVTKIVTQCNYCYIAELGRYYYVVSAVGIAENIIELRLRVDVLMSFKTAIKAQNVIVSRNEKEYRLYLDDEKIKVYNNPNICVYTFKDQYGDTTKFTGQYFIMALAGS